MSADTRPAFQLKKPDLGRWRSGNTGIEGIWRFEAPEPGPDVLVTALVHGNELCGAWAVLAALEAELRPRRGSLTLGFCNVRAFDRFDPAAPDDSRYVDQDLNRLWGEMRWKYDGVAAFTVEQRRVLELRPIVERSDWLLDLHSMHEPGPPTLLTGLAPRNVLLARELGVPELVVIDAGHREGRRMRDHGRFADLAENGTRSLLIECGYHGDLRSRDVALDILGRFLEVSGCVESGDVPPLWRQPEPARQQVLEVTAAVTALDGDAGFAEPWQSGQCIPLRGTLLGWNGGQRFATPYDNCTLVMPSLRHAHPGATIVRLARPAAGTGPGMAGQSS